MSEKVEIKRYRESVNKEILFKGHTEGSKLVNGGGFVAHHSTGNGYR